MKGPASILIVVDHGEGVVEYLGKAVRFARRFGARIELFLCEAGQAYALAHQYDRQGVEGARTRCLAAASAYLEYLKALVDAHGVDISVVAACESPLYTGIVRQVLRSKPDLVIKRADQAESRRPGAPDPNDWQLMCTCPATLMLVRGRPWRIPARFATAIDVSEGETAGLSKNVLASGRAIASAWHAELHVIYAEASTSAPVRAHDEELRRLCEANDISSNRIHVLRGDPVAILPSFAAAEHYDMLILGALAHRPGSAAQPGGLTSKLVDMLDCDFVLVKPPSYQSPVGEGLQRPSTVHPTA